MKEPRFKEQPQIKVKLKEVQPKPKDGEKDRDTRPEPRSSKPQAGGSFRFIRKQLSEAQLLEWAYYVFAGTLN